MIGTSTITSHALTWCPHLRRTSTHVWHWVIVACGTVALFFVTNSGFRSLDTLAITLRFGSWLPSAASSLTFSCHSFFLGRETVSSAAMARGGPDTGMLHPASFDSTANDWCAHVKPIGNQSGTVPTLPRTESCPRNTATGPPQHCLHAVKHMTPFPIHRCTLAWNAFSIRSMRCLIDGIAYIGVRNRYLHPNMILRRPK